MSVPPLWSSDEIARATGGDATGAFAASGVTFDSREVGPGDLFVALSGEATDGHRFLDQAYAQGASGALVSQGDARPGVRVTDTFAALEDLGRAARARTNAKIIGVTGSVGKTSAKEALFACLDRGVPGAANRSVKSYNNHTGVPLSLARMPAATRYGVFEMGMNHPGELAHLTTLVRPHVAIVTAIAPAHTEFFSDESAIADAKGEIFAGLEPGGVAIIPYDSPHRERLIAAATPYASRIVTFGIEPGADVRPLETMRVPTGGTFVTAKLQTSELSFTIAQPGAHWVSNALAVLAAVEAVGADLGLAGLALAEMGGLQGRGARFIAKLLGGEALVIDESYNANPASMAATLAVLAHEPGRHVALLGEMRELGEKSADYHAALAEPILAARVETALLVGEAMAPLATALEGRVDFVHVRDAAAALDHLAMIAPGDAVLVKGSNGVGLARVVASLAGEELVLFWIAEQLGFPGVLNLFRYQTTRIGGAIATALMIGLIIGPRFIGWLRVRQGQGQPIRADGPQTHLAKRGTPTMGGLMILTSLTLSVLLWMDLSNPFVWSCLFVTLGFGAIGFMDDYDKVTKASHAGVSGRTRLILEFAIAGIAAFIIMQENGTGLFLPFTNRMYIELWWFYPLFAAFTIVAFGNAVNLTDGLDGLASMPVIIASLAFMVIVYLAGNIKFADYLGIPHVPRAGELAIFCGAMIGAGLAFLWFNAPAAVFMGDTGSLALGGALGTIAVTAHHEIVLGIIGGLFVVEAMSVIIQVFFYKRTGKRVFRMAPIHHHFEQLGWSEPTVVIRFWIIAFVLALAGLSTLKLR